MCQGSENWRGAPAGTLAARPQQSASHAADERGTPLVAREPLSCPRCNAELSADGFCDACGYDTDDEDDDNFDADELGDDPEED